MEQISILPSTAIPVVLGPTFAAFIPLLVANKTSILSTPSTTHSYGSHPRQTLDIYPPTSSSSDAPILIFLYGGGLTRGDKILPLGGGLIYHNLGAFFAQRNFLTIIADYRRVTDPQTGAGEDAVYPSGGQDLAAVLEWLTQSYLADGKQGREVFVMGNSAGGVHMTTWLLDARFEEQRRALVAGEGKARLAGVVLNSVPVDFAQADESRRGVLDTYWNPQSNPAKDFCPAGLLASFVKTGSGKSPKDMGIPPVLILIGELDPEDEIVEPNLRLLDVWKTGFGETGLERMDMKGHNHISPPLALMSGQGEEWGVDLVRWMEKSIH